MGWGGGGRVRFYFVLFLRLGLGLLFRLLGLLSPFGVMERQREKCPSDFPILFFFVSDLVLFFLFRPFFCSTGCPPPPTPHPRSSLFRGPPLGGRSVRTCAPIMRRAKIKKKKAKTRYENPVKPGCGSFERRWNKDEPRFAEPKAPRTRSQPGRVGWGRGGGEGRGTQQMVLVCESFPGF